MYSLIPLTGGLILLWRGGEDAVVPELLLGAVVLAGLWTTRKAGAASDLAGWVLRAWFLFLAVQTAFLSSYFHRSFLVLYPWWMGFGTYLAARGLLRRAPDRLRAVELSLDVLGGALFLSCAFGLYVLWGEGNWHKELTGTFYWKNQMAIAIAVLFLPFVARIRGLGTRVAVATYVFLAGFFLICLLLARSAGALGALALGVLYLGWRTWKLRRMETRFIPHVLGAGAILLAAAAVLKPGWTVALSNQLQQVFSGGYSVTGRLVYWDAAVKIGLRFPAFGAGLGNYRYLYPQFQPQLGYYSDNPHNLPLQLFAETGMVGLILFAVFLVLFARGRLRSAPESGRAGWMTLSIEAAWVAALFHACVDFDWTFGFLVLLFFLLMAWMEEVPAPGAPAPAGTKWGAPMGLLVAGVTAALWLGMTAEGVSRFWQAKARPLLYKGDSAGEPLARKAIQAFPLAAEPIRELAQYEYAARDSRCADRAERAVRLNPNDSMAHNILGNCLLLRGEWEGAQRELERGLQLDPWNMPTYYRDVARFYLSPSPATDWDKAEKMVDRALQLYPYATPREVYDAVLTWRDLHMNLVLAQLHTLKAGFCAGRNDAECVKLHQEGALALNRPE